MSEVNDDWVIGCFTPSRGRQLALRACMMQMQMQTRRPDIHAILFNGPHLRERDDELVRDLYDGSVLVGFAAEEINSPEASARTIEILYARDNPKVNLFFKIDNDDLYRTNYIESVLKILAEKGLGPEDQNPWCLNLTHQWWIKYTSMNRVEHAFAVFENGLGLSHYEIEKGMRVGIPSTNVLNRAAIEIIRTWRESRYAGDNMDDRIWRHVLYDAGVIIHTAPTYMPVFGYVRHSENASFNGG